MNAGALEDLRPVDDELRGPAVTCTGSREKKTVTLLQRRPQLQQPGCFPLLELAKRKRRENGERDGPKRRRRRIASLRE